VEYLNICSSNDFFAGIHSHTGIQHSEILLHISTVPSCHDPNTFAYIKLKLSPKQVRGDLWDCEMLKIPHGVDNRFTDGNKVVSLTRRPRSTPQAQYFPDSDTNFC
jgi:hypothetical protein